MTIMYSLVFNKTIRNPIYYVETKRTQPGIYSIIVVELCWLSSRIDKVLAQVECSKKEEAIAWHKDFCKELKVHPFEKVVEILQARYPANEKEKEMAGIKEEVVTKKEKKESKK